MNEKRATKTQQRDTGGDIPPAEWVAAAIGLLLTVAAVATLALNAARTKEPPSIVFAIDTIVRTPAAFVVKVRAQNRGDETAAALKIEAILTDSSGRTVERSEVMLDYLPGHSAREFGVFFNRPPSENGLRVRASGYAVP